MNEYTTGTLAYIDTLRSGLVPCKVVGITDETQDYYPYAKRLRITVKVTAKRFGYAIGETVDLFSPEKVVPRSSVFVRNGKYHIRNNYTWKG